MSSQLALALTLTTLTILSFFSLLPDLASAHGMMCTPRQRGAYTSSDKCGTSLDSASLPFSFDDLEVDYCPHCLNGGAIATTSQHLPSGGWKLYDPIVDPSGSLFRASPCGDAFSGSEEHMLGGRHAPPGSPVPIVGTYKSGSYIDFSAELDTNHNGYFEFYLCDISKCGVTNSHGHKDLTPSCFENGHCHKLLRQPHPDCEGSASNEEMHTQCGPIDDKYPGRWYVPCRNTGHVGVHVVGGDNGYMRYKLPDSVKTCEHCVVQWYWATANSCAPRGFLEFMTRMGNPFGSTCPGDGGAVGAYRAGMTECGGNTIPEEFWSCADVRITGDGEGSDNTVVVTDSDDDQEEEEEEEEEEEQSVSSPTRTPTPEPSPSVSSMPVLPTPPPTQTPTPSPSSTTTATTMSDSTNPTMSAWPSISAWPSTITDINPDREEEGCTPRGVECTKDSMCCGWNRACAFRRSYGKFMCSAWVDMQMEFHRYWTPPSSSSSTV